MIKEIEKNPKGKIFIILIFIVITIFYFQFSKTDFKKSVNITEDVEGEIIIEESEYIVPSKYDNIKLKTVEEAEAENRYLLHASWPVTENEKINELLDEKAQAFIDEFKEVSADIQKSREEYIEETGNDGATFHADYNMHFDVAFADENYLAFVFSLFRNTGNTGNNNVLSLIFNRKSGEVIPVSDLFVSSDYLTKLSELAREDLYRRAEEEADLAEFDSKEERELWIENLKKEMIDLGTLPKAENFKNIVINDEGILEIHFDKYQVAPGYWGRIEIEIPLERVQELFVPEVKKLFNLEEEKMLEEKTEKKEVKDNLVGEEVILNEVETESLAVDCTKEKCIALTFDDGPSVYTEILLSTLQEKGVKATFFVLGVNARVQQQTIIDLNKAGMEIGNHTWSHKDLTKLSVEAVKEEVNNSADLISNIIGKRPFLVRPPYGAINGQVKAVANSPLILWNVDPEDWKYHDSDYVAKHIIEHVKSGAIVLSHDIHKTTVEAIPEVIDTLLSEGYKLVTVSELFGEVELEKGQTYSYN